MTENTVASICLDAGGTEKQVLERHIDYIGKAANAGASLIVFPEQSLEVPGNKCPPEKTEEWKIELIIKKSRECGTYTVFGYIEEENGRLYNSQLLTGPCGAIGKYRKICLTPEEKRFFSRGHEFKVFGTDIGAIGMETCYDKSFPEISRELVLRGANIIVNPCAWPKRRGKDYPHGTANLSVIYNKARAAENQCFFISSDFCGEKGKSEYAGVCEITGPDGEVLAGGFGGERMVCAKIGFCGRHSAVRSKYDIAAEARELTCFLRRGGINLRY